MRDYRIRRIGEKNELVSWLPGYCFRMMFEIPQESLGILIKKEYIKNETQVVEKRKLASYLFSLENHIKRVLCCMRKFCIMPWGKNLVLPVSRI